MANGIDSAPISAAIFQRIYTAGNIRGRLPPIGRGGPPDTSKTAGQPGLAQAHSLAETRRDPFRSAA